MALAAIGFLLIMWGIAAIVSSFQGQSLLSEFSSILNLKKANKA